MYVIGALPNFPSLHTETEEKNLNLIQEGKLPGLGKSGKTHWSWFSTHGMRQTRSLSIRLVCQTLQHHPGKVHSK